MMYREVAPHPKLRKYIKCFWTLEHDYGNSIHDHERLWADAHTELIFTSGRRYFRKVAGKTVTLPPSFVVGPFQNQLQLFCNGGLTLVAARFWPWGFHALSKIPMTQLKNTVQGSRRVLGGAVATLDAVIADAEGPDARIAGLEQALLNVIGLAQGTELHSRPIAGEILDSRGMTRIGELLKGHGIQARRLERIFLDEIGMTAKVLSRIVRFNHAKSMIETDPEIDLRKLAFECGYADQPHFTRNFREMFGITPAHYKADMKYAMQRFKENPADVVFLQDEAAVHG